MRGFKLLLMGLCLFVLGTGQASGEEEETIEVWDPFEMGNRVVFDFFMLTYYITLHPLVGVYNGVIPQVVRDRVDDFAGMTRMPVTIVNDILQGNKEGLEKTVERTAKDLTTGGLYDYERNKPRRFEDYGQTLGVYGVPEGPFLMFPLAPTVRDAGMYTLQTLYLNPLNYVVSAPFDMVFLAVRLTSLFSLTDKNLVSVFRSVDGYALTRSAFLQQRRGAVADRGADREELKRREGAFDLELDEQLLLEIDEELLEEIEQKGGEGKR